MKTLVSGEVAQSCPTLCDLVDCSLPGSSIHGILQTRILEWVAISFSRGSSRPRDRTQVSCIGGRRFNLWATREARWRRYYRLSGHALNPMASVLVRDTQRRLDRQKRRLIHREEWVWRQRQPCGWCAHKPRKIRKADSHQNLEEARKDSFLKPPEGVGPADILISVFWTSELWKNKFLFI